MLNTDHAQSRSPLVITHSIAGHVASDKHTDFKDTVALAWTPETSSPILSEDSLLTSIKSMQKCCNPAPFSVIYAFSIIYIHIVCIYIHTYTHVYIHIYTHTLVFRLLLLQNNETGRDMEKVRASICCFIPQILIVRARLGQSKARRQELNPSLLYWG